MQWHDLAFPTDASLVCKHSAEMLGMEDVYEQDTDISHEWKEVDQDFECDILLSEYQTYDEETASLMLLDDDTLMYMMDDSHTLIPMSDTLPDYEDAWDDEWFWAQRSAHITSWAATKQYYWEKSHTKPLEPAPKPFTITIAPATIIINPEPVIAVIADSVKKEVEPEPILNLPKYNPKESFVFKTGVVIKMNYIDGEMMHKNDEYRRAFNSRQTQDFLDRGFQFDHKHEVLYKPQ